MTQSRYLSAILFALPLMQLAQGEPIAIAGQPSSGATHQELRQECAAATRSVVDQNKMRELQVREVQILGATFLSVACSVEVTRRDYDERGAFTDSPVQYFVEVNLKTRRSEAWPSPSSVGAVESNRCLRDGDSIRCGK